MVFVRTARSSDAPVIAEVKKKVWPEEESNVAYIANAIAAADHIVHVAVSQSRVVGFVDGFMTVSDSGIRRWEVDLLAVYPDHWRQGIAKRLIRATTDAGSRDLKAHIARALIHVDNVGSMRSFERCGYHTQDEICGLYISTVEGDSHDWHTERIHVIPVNTFNYCGLWIEGDLSPDAFQYANNMRHYHQLDLCGTVISTHHEKIVRAALQAGYHLVGHYRWWELPIQSVRQDAVLEPQ